MKKYEPPNCTVSPSPAALRPNADYDLLIQEVSRSHTTKHLISVGLLWTSDQLVTETST